MNSRHAIPVHAPRIPNARTRTLSRLLLMSAVVFVPAGPLDAQTLSFPTAEQRRQHADGVIEGIITRGAQIEPTRGVLVVIHGNSNASPPKPIVRHAISDRAGKFRFTDLLNGNYNLSVSKAGFDVGYMQPPWAYLEGPEARSEIQIRLKKRPVVTGRVVDGNGRAVPHAQLQLLRARANEGHTFVENSSSASTDDRGVFRVSVRQAGRYWIKASHMETSFPLGSAPRSTGIVFYPNSPDLLAAAALHFDFDQPETELNVALPWAPATSLTAQVFSGVKGVPCVQCMWQVWRVEGMYEYSLASGSTARRAGLDLGGMPPGRYRIYITDSASGQDRYGVAETVVPEGRPVELSIVTQPPAPLSGRVVLDSPPQQVLESLTTSENAIRVNISPIGQSAFGTGNGQAQDSLRLEELEFMLGPIPPGSFRLRAWATAVGGYVAGISRQGRPLGSRVIEIEPGGAYDNFEIRVRFDAAEIRSRVSGVVVGREPPETYRIELVPDASSNPYGQHFSGQCTPEGDCHASGLVPGKYRAVALPQGIAEQVAIGDSSSAEWLNSWGRELLLGPGNNPAMEIPAPPDSALRSLLEPPHRQ